MKWFIRFSILFFFVTCNHLLSQASSLLANEVLRYSVQYKWGLVHKKAGDAVLTLQKKDNRAYLKLTGRSLPWVDRFFRVRDTLVSVTDPVAFTPYYYEKNAHEGKYVSSDKLTFTKSGNSTKVSVEKYKINDKGVRSESKNALSAAGNGFDMLSVFYYLRTLDYASMPKGKSFTVNLFSGKQVERLKITSDGLEKVKLLNNKMAEAYKLRMTFTRDGKKKSSDDITVWMSTDSRKIPLYLIGKLKFGEVRVYYDS